MGLRLGILLDSWYVRSWQAAIIRYVISHVDCEVVFVVLNNRARVSHTRRSKILYSLGRKLDRKLFRVKFDCFQSVNVEPLLSGTNTFVVDPITRRFTDAFPDADLLKIQSTAPDIIIRFGFRILTGEVLRVARYGVWSLHHGDTAINRGGPPGFWEVVQGDEVSGVTLQVLSDELDGGHVIDKAFSRTNRTSFNRNQNDLFWSGVELFCSSIDRQSRDSEFYLNTRWNQQFYSGPLYRDPSNLQSLKIFADFWLRRITEFVSGRSKRWNIYLMFGKSPGKALYKFKALRKPANFDWADPFVVQKGLHYFLFFEELKIGTTKGHISMLKFDLQGEMLSEGPLRVLDEPYHLSYPFVFEYREWYYMTPECGNDHRVWLYRAIEFPMSWKRIRLLIDKELYDPTLIQHESVWYMFATEKPFEGNSPDQYLVIYFTDDLLNGEWTRHPRSPSVRDARVARPAGRIFWEDGRMLRPAQVGAPNYGYGVVFMQITLLTKFDYREVYFDTILPKWRAGIRGVHTFNQAGGMTVVDAQVHQ